MLVRASKFISLLLMCALLAGLTACSGSSGDPAAAPSVATRLVAGSVEDGPISGALVRLLDRTSMAPVLACGASGLGLCSQIFDNPDGHFSFVLAMHVDPETLLVEATGGVDQATRIDFSRNGFATTPLRMLAPLDRYLDRIDRVSINPLTTLAALSESAAPAPQDSSQHLLAGLGMAQAGPIFGSPAQSAETQRLALLLSKLAILSSSEDPFSAIADYLLAGHLLIDGSGQLSSLELESAGILAAEQVAELQALHSALLNVANPGQMSAALRQQEIIQGFLAALTDPANSVLPEPGLVATAEPHLQQNLQTLADMILNAVGDQLLLGGAVPEHLARFVLYAYELEDPLKLGAEPEVFSHFLSRFEQGAAIALDTDPALLGLANLQVSQAVSVPLPYNGLLSGDDLTLSDRKRDYYYHSDISHLYQAKQLVWNVNDDQVNDAVMLQVVEGEALAGRFAEAETLLRTQIYQSDARGQAYLKFAKGLMLHGLQSEALTAMDEAKRLFLNVVDAKGVASFSRADAQNFRDLAKGYIQADSTLDALAVVQYLADNVAGYLTTTSSYGNLTTAGMDVVDAFVELGDLVNAETALDLTFQLTLGVPDDSNGTAKYRVRELITVAERFAELGYLPQVVDVWNSIQLLRYAGDQITATGTSTELYMPKLAVAIYAAGMIAEAFELIATLPVGTGVLERYQMEGYKRLATYLAVRDQGLGPELQSLPDDPVVYTAMDLINFFLIPDFFNATVADSQIEALTYYNSSLAYVAQAMIDKHLITGAIDALIKAEQIVDGLDDNGVKLKSNAKVNYGYAKLAELYLQFDDFEQATRLLGKGVDVLPLISDPTYHAKAVALLAEMYLDLGDFNTASSLLATIGETVDLDGYFSVVEAFINAGVYQTALDFVAEYAEVAAASYDPLTMDDSSLAVAATSNLVKAARFYSRLGTFPEAVATLQRALPVAWDIPTETTRMARLIDIAAGLATARAFQQAQELAWSLPYVSNRNDALQAIAETLATRDDFPDTPFATIDLDGDGLPDFFSVDASSTDIQYSGLSLDRDSDNDGVADDQDRWPFYGMLPSHP